MSFVNPKYRVHMPSVAFLFTVLAVAGFLEFSGHPCRCRHGAGYPFRDSRGADSPCNT